MEKQPRVSIIAAIAENRAIGKGNRLLWDIPEDMQHFRSVTAGHPVIMGQKTYESIGHPLPKRLNIVLSKNPGFAAPGCTVCRSLPEAIELASHHDEREVFIIGGGQVYAQAMPLAQRLYLTVVAGTYEADTYFPDYAEFSTVVSRRESRDGNYSYTFFVLER